MAALSRCSRFLLSRGACLPKGVAFSSISRRENKILLPVTSAVHSHLRFLVSTGVDIRTKEEERPTQHHAFKDCLHNLEMWLGKFRQASSFNVRQCLQKFKTDGIGNFQDGLMVLRATGEPLCEYHPDKRMELTNEVWDCIVNSGLKLGTNHYNSLITVYLENKHKFSPPDIIEQMENKGVLPSRLTFQLLISAYCENGDIDKASQILEHMKDHNIPLTDTVFNSLIRGHFRMKDTEGALNMVDLMNQSGLEPASETYASLIQGYADMRDVDSINKMFTEAEENGVVIQSYHLMDAIFTSIHSGSEDIAYQIFDKLKASGRTFHSPLRRTILKLATYGHVDAASKLYSDNFENSELFRSILKAIVINLNAENYGDKMKELIDGNHELARSLLRLASNEDRSDWVLMLLQNYKEHLSRPMSDIFNLLLKRARSGDVDCLLKFESVLEKEGSSNHFLLKVFLPNGVVPVLAKEGVPVDTLCSNLKEKGFGVISSIVESVWLFSNDLGRALEYGKTKPVVLNHSVCDAIFSNADFKTQWEDILQVVKKSSIYHNVKVSILERILKENPDKAIDIMKYCKTEKIHLAHGVRDTLKSLDLLTEAHKEGIFAASTSPDVDLAKLSVAQLQSQIKRNPQFIKPKIILLGELVNEEKYDEAVEVLKSLEKLHADSDIPSYNANVNALKLYAEYKKDVQLAEKYLTRIETIENEGKPAYRHFEAFYNTLGLMLEEGKLEDTIPHIKHFLKYHAKQNRAGTKSISLIASSLAKSVKPEEAFDYLQRLIELQFIHPEQQTYWIRTIFDQYCQSFDPDSVVEMAKDLAKKKMNIPLFTVMNFLIEKENEASLQKLVDFFSPLFNEVSVLLNLMCSLVYNNKLSQARAVAKLPGLWGDMKVITYCTNGFIQEKKVKELEELVEITKDIDGCDRDGMLGILIKGYAMAGDMQAAKGVLDKYKEEDIIPSAETLEFLAQQLKANGMEVDFYVPASKSDEAKDAGKKGKNSQVSSAPLQETVNEVIGLVKSNGDYVAYLENLFNSSSFTSKEARVKLLKQLNGQMSRKDFGKVLCWLKDSGNIDVIDSAGLQNAPHRLLALELLNRSPADLVEVLQTLKAEEFRKYISLSLISLLKSKSPEDFETVASMIRKHGVNNWSAVKSLWIQHACDSEFDKATALLEDLPDSIKKNLLKSIKVQDICKREVKKQNDEVLLYMADVMKDVDYKTKSIFGYLLEVYTRQNDIEKTRGTMARLQNEGHELSQFPPAVRMAVESLYQRHGLSLPTQVDKSSSSANEQSKEENVQHEER